MEVKLVFPEWIEKGSVTVRLAELNPESTEAETLRDAMERDDDRVRLLIDLWEAMTAD